MTEDTKGREFEVAAQVSELLDTLRPAEQKQIMAMLASRYGLKITEPSSPVRGDYKPSPKRRS